MKRNRRHLRHAIAVAALVAVAGCAFGQATSTAPETPGPRLQVYGFAMLDLIYDFNQVDPNWFDMLRPS
jgi:hypothetical protein